MGEGLLHLILVSLALMKAGGPVCTDDSLWALSSISLPSA